MFRCQMTLKDGKHQHKRKLGFLSILPVLAVNFTDTGYTGTECQKAIQNTEDLKDTTWKHTNFFK